MNCGANELWRLLLITTLVPILTQARHDEDLRPSLSCLLMGDYGCKCKCALLCKTYGCIDWNSSCDSVYCDCKEQWEPITIEPDIVEEFEGLVDFDDVLAVKFKRTPVFLDLEDTLYENPDLMDEVMYFLRHTHGHGKPFKDQFRLTFPELNDLLRRLKPRPLKEKKGNSSQTAEVPNEPLGNLDPPSSRWGFLSDWWNKPSPQANSKENEERIINMVNGVEKKEDLLSTMQMLKDSGGTPLYTDITKHFLKNGLIMADGTRILEPISDTKVLKKSLANDGIIHAIEDKIEEEEEFKREKKRKQMQQPPRAEKKPKIEPVMVGNPDSNKNAGNQPEESKSSLWGLPNWFSSKPTGSIPSEVENAFPQVSLPKVNPSEYSNFVTESSKPSNINNQYLPYDDQAESIYDDGYYSETSKENSWPNEEANSLPQIQHSDENDWKYGNLEHPTQSNHNKLEYSDWPADDHYIGNQFDDYNQHTEFQSEYPLDQDDEFTDQEYTHLESDILPNPEDTPTESKAQSNIAPTEPDWFNFSWETDNLPISPVEEEFLKKKIPQTDYGSLRPQLENNSHLVDTSFANVKLDQPALTDSSPYFFGDSMHSQKTSPQNIVNGDHQEVISLPNGFDLGSSISDESSDGRDLHFFLGKQPAEESTKQINISSSISMPIINTNASNLEESEDEANNMLQNLLKLANAPVNNSMPKENADSMSVETRNLGSDQGFDELQLSNPQNKLFESSQANSLILDDTSAFDNDYIIERTHLNRLNGIIPDSSESMEHVPVKRIIRKKKVKPIEETPIEKVFKEKAADESPKKSMFSFPQSMTSVQFEGLPGSPILQIDGLPFQQLNSNVLSNGGTLPKSSAQPYSQSIIQEPKVKSSEKPNSHISEGLKNILPAYVTDDFSASIEDMNESELEKYTTDNDRVEPQSSMTSYKPGAHIPTNIMTDGSILPMENSDGFINPLSEYTKKLDSEQLQDTPYGEFNVDGVLSSEPSKKVSQGSRNKFPSNKNSISKSPTKIPITSGSKKGLPLHDTDFGLPQLEGKVSNLENNPLRNQMDAEDLNPSLLGDEEAFIPKFQSFDIAKPLSDTDDKNAKLPEDSEMRKNSLKIPATESPISLNRRPKMSNNKPSSLPDINQNNDDINISNIFTNPIMNSPTMKEDLPSENEIPLPKISSNIGTMPDINFKDGQNLIPSHADSPYILETDQDVLLPSMEEEKTSITPVEDVLEKNNLSEIINRPPKPAFPNDQIKSQSSLFDIPQDFDESEPMADILSHSSYNLMPEYDTEYSKPPTIPSINSSKLLDNPLSQQMPGQKVNQGNLFSPSSEEKYKLSPTKVKISDNLAEPQISNPAPKYISKPVNPSKTAKKSDKNMPAGDRKKKIANIPPPSFTTVPGESNINSAKNGNLEQDMLQNGNYTPGKEMPIKSSNSNLKIPPGKKEMVMLNPVSQNDESANPFEQEHQNNDNLMKLGLPSNEHANILDEDIDFNDFFGPPKKTLFEEDSHPEDGVIDLSSFLGLYDENHLEDHISNPNNKIKSDELPGNNHHEDIEEIFKDSGQADFPILLKVDKDTETPNKIHPSNQNGNKVGMFSKIGIPAPTNDDSLYADDSSFDDFSKSSNNPTIHDSHYSGSEDLNPFDRKQLEDLDNVLGNEKSKGTIPPSKLDNSSGLENNSILTNSNGNPLEYKIYDGIKSATVPSQATKTNPNLNDGKNQQPSVTEINSPRFDEEPDFDDFFKSSSSPNTDDTKPDDNDIDLNMFLGINGLDEFNDLMDNGFNDEKRKNKAAELDDFSGMDDLLDNTEIMPTKINDLIPHHSMVGQPSTTLVDSSNVDLQPNVNNFVKLPSNIPYRENDEDIEPNLFSIKDGINQADNFTNDSLDNDQQNEENIANKLEDLASGEDLPNNFGAFDLPNRYKLGAKKKIPILPGLISQIDLNPNNDGNKNQYLPHTNDKYTLSTSDEPSFDDFNVLSSDNNAENDDLLDGGFNWSSFPGLDGIHDLNSILDNDFNEEKEKTLGSLPSEYDDFSGLNDLDDENPPSNIPYKENYEDIEPNLFSIKDGIGQADNFTNDSLDNDQQNKENIANELEDLANVEDLPNNFGAFDLPNRHKLGVKKKVPILPGVISQIDSNPNNDGNKNQYLPHTNDKYTLSTSDEPSFDDFNVSSSNNNAENDDLLDGGFNWSSFPGLDDIHDLNSILDNDFNEEKEKTPGSLPSEYDDFSGLNDLLDDENPLENKAFISETTKDIPKMPITFTPINSITGEPSENIINDFQPDSTHSSNNNAVLTEFPFPVDKKSRIGKNGYLPHDLLSQPGIKESKLATLPQNDSARTSTFEEPIPQEKVVSEYSPDLQKLPSDFIESSEDGVDDIPSVAKLFPNLISHEKYFPEENLDSSSILSGSRKQPNKKEDIPSFSMKIPVMDTSSLPDDRSEIHLGGNDFVPHTDLLVDGEDNGKNVVENVDDSPSDKTLFPYDFMNLKDEKPPNTDFSEQSNPSENLDNLNFAQPSLMPNNISGFSDKPEIILPSIKPTSQKFPNKKNSSIKMQGKANPSQKPSKFPSNKSPSMRDSQNIPENDSIFPSITSDILKPSKNSEKVFNPTLLASKKLPHTDDNLLGHPTTGDLTATQQLVDHSNNMSPPSDTFYEKSHEYLEFPKITEINLTEEIPNTMKKSPMKIPDVRTSMDPTSNASNLLPVEIEDIMENNLVFPSEDFIEFPNKVEGIETSSFVPSDEQFPFARPKNQRPVKNSNLFKNVPAISKNTLPLDNKGLTGDNILESPEQPKIPDDVLASLSEILSDSQIDSIKSNLASTSPELIDENFSRKGIFDTESLIDQIPTSTNPDQNIKYDNEQWDSLLERLPFFDTDNVYSNSMEDTISNYASNNPLSNPKLQKGFENEDFAADAEVNIEGNTLPPALSETLLKSDFPIPQTSKVKSSKYPKKQSLLDNLPLQSNQIADQLEMKPQELLLTDFWKPSSEDQLGEEEENKSTSMLINEKLVPQISRKPGNLFEVEKQSNSYPEMNMVPNDAESTFFSEPIMSPEIFVNANSINEVSQPTIILDSGMKESLENKIMPPNRQKPKLEKGPKKSFENVTAAQTPVNKSGIVNAPIMEEPTQYNLIDNVKQPTLSLNQDLRDTPLSDGRKILQTPAPSKAEFKNEGSSNSVTISPDSEMKEPINSSQLHNQWPMMEKIPKKSLLKKPDVINTPETSSNFLLGYEEGPNVNLGENSNDMPNLTTYEELLGDTFQSPLKHENLDQVFLPKHEEELKMTSMIEPSITGNHKNTIVPEGSQYLNNDTDGKLDDEKIFFENLASNPIYSGIKNSELGYLPHQEDTTTADLPVSISLQPVRESNLKHPKQQIYNIMGDTAFADNLAEDVEASLTPQTVANSHPLEKNIESNFEDISEIEEIRKSSFLSPSAGEDISITPDDIKFAHSIDDDASSIEQPWADISQLEKSNKAKKAKKIPMFESGDVDSAEEKLLQQMMKGWPNNKETLTKIPPIITDDNEISLLPENNELLSNNVDDITSPSQMIHSNLTDFPHTYSSDDININAPYIPSDQMKAAKSNSKISNTPDQVLSEINNENNDSKSQLEFEHLPTTINLLTKSAPSVDMSSGEPLEKVSIMESSDKKQAIEEVPIIYQVDDTNSPFLAPLVDKENDINVTEEQKIPDKSTMENIFDLEAPNDSMVFSENNQENSNIPQNEFPSSLSPLSTPQSKLIPFESNPILIPQSKRKPAKFKKIMDFLNPESVINKVENLQNNAEDVPQNQYEPLTENTTDMTKIDYLPEIPNDIRFSIDNETGEISSIIVPAENIINKSPILNNQNFIDDSIIGKAPTQQDLTLPVEPSAYSDNLMAISNNGLANQSKTSEQQFSETNNISPELPMSLMDILKLNDVNSSPEFNFNTDSNNLSADLPAVSKSTTPTVNYTSDDEVETKSESSQKFTEPSLLEPDVSLIDILKPNHLNKSPEFISSNKLDNTSAYLPSNINIPEDELPIPNQIDTLKKQLVKQSDISPEPPMSLVDILNLNNFDDPSGYNSNNQVLTENLADRPNQIDTFKEPLAKQSDISPEPPMSLVDILNLNNFDDPSGYNSNNEVLTENLADRPSNKPVTSLPIVNSNLLMNNQQKPNQIVRPSLPRPKPSNSQQAPSISSSSNSLKQKNDVNANVPNIATVPKVKAPSANLDAIITKAESIPQSVSSKPPSSGPPTQSQSMKKPITPRPVQVPTQSNKMGPKISLQNDSNIESSSRKPAPDNVQQKINDLMSSFPEEAEGSLSLNSFKMDEPLIFGLGQPVKPKPTMGPTNNTKPLRNTNGSFINNQSSRPTQQPVQMNSKPQTLPANSRPPTKPSSSRPTPATNNLSAKPHEFDFNDPFSIFSNKETTPATNSVPSSQIERVPKSDFDGFGDLDIFAGDDKFTEQEMMLAIKNPKVRPDILLSAQNTGNTNTLKVEKPPRPSFAKKNR